MQKLVDLYFDEWIERKYEKLLEEDIRFNENLKQCCNGMLTQERLMKLEDLASDAFAAYERAGFYAGYNSACQVLKEMFNGDANEKE